MARLPLITVYKVGFYCGSLMWKGAIWRYNGTPAKQQVPRPSDSYRIWDFTWGSDPDET